MGVLVNDTGFAADDWDRGFAVPQDWSGAEGLDLAPDADVEGLRDLLAGAVMIRVGFPTFSDGRGYSIARRLRLLGYAGRLRAQGHVIADQYAMARRCGFDEVEISAELAARQPVEQWLFRADWRAHDYRSRLGAYDHPSRPEPGAQTFARADQALERVGEPAPLPSE